MELTVIIPTRGRRAILRETLDRLEAQQDDAEFEVVVVDDGSTDGTVEMVRNHAARLAFPLMLIEQPRRGPAAARNRALAVAQAPVCLFIDDDSWPRAGLLARHRDFHRRRPEREAALLGLIAVAPAPPPTPFMLWLANVNHPHDDIEDPEAAGGFRFLTGNVSVKSGFLRDVGGFDERQRPAHEDIDLGLRLEHRGMRLAYDADAVVDHYQPADLPATIERMSGIGRSLALLAERHPHVPRPGPPGIRHRVKAAALTTFAALGIRTPRVQRETWRFLCHEAGREGYWWNTELRIGRTLARLASRDPDVQLPSGDPTLGASEPSSGAERSAAAS
jgi:glycosyltransferase involved in cell wall biosynthesis